ncbi:hypothetical protein IV203_028101 [Nitzschia inconspicua]|uniref:Uncharacterized protein n=1 Tax=Nitzschia inconspicua TaxID=303405 RepID=A0A9K3LXM1_9STRA|nr:hypothetical protein IV203_028101 [Nitzschia inconspicua]
MAASSRTRDNNNHHNHGSLRHSSLVFLLMKVIIVYFVLCVLQSTIVSNAFGPSIGTSFHHRMGFCASPPSLVSRTVLGVYPPCCDNESTRNDESTSKAIKGGGEDYHHSSFSRRDLLIHGVRSLAIPAATITTAGGGSTVSVAHAAASSSSSPTADTVKELLTQLQQADQQMNDIPKLIDGEKWDSVRAILIAPPLSDCWAKTNRPLVQKYAQALGDAGGDELAALEAKEELEGRLRYLDMAVYNNNFNPITVEGTTNASPTLIQSYYEDPQREYKASRKALQELIQLANDAGLQ